MHTWTDQRKWQEEMKMIRIKEENIQGSKRE